MAIAQTIDVEQLLIWAYRDECVAYGDNDRGRAQVANRIYFMGGLGTLVDGGGRRLGTVPEDALTVEAAVAKLTGYRRDLVSMHATAGTRPSIRWERPQAFTCDVFGSLTGKPRHLFSPQDRGKRNPIACYVGFHGDSIESLSLRWKNYRDWWSALLEIDQALRNNRTRLKAWELADFSVPQSPWEADPAVPAWLCSRVYLTWGKNVDTFPLTVGTARREGQVT